MIKKTYTCDPETEEFVTIVLNNFSLNIFNLILEEVGSNSKMKLEVIDGIVVKTNNYHITIDVLDKINKKGFNNLIDKVLRSGINETQNYLSNKMEVSELINKNLEKTCTQCEKSKSLTEFYKNKTKKFGVNGICKTCQKNNRFQLALKSNEGNLNEQQLKEQHDNRLKVVDKL